MEAEEPDPYEGEEGANPFGFSASKPGSSSLAQLFGGGDASAGSLSYQAPKAPAPAAAAPERGATQQPKASILLSLRAREVYLLCVAFPCRTSDMPLTGFACGVVSRRRIGRCHRARVASPSLAMPPWARTPCCCTRARSITSHACPSPTSSSWRRRCGARLDRSLTRLLNAMHACRRQVNGLYVTLYDTAAGQAGVWTLLFQSEDEVRVDLAWRAHPTHLTHLWAAAGTAVRAGHCPGQVRGDGRAWADRTVGPHS